MKKTDEEIINKIIYDLEHQGKNVDIAKKYNVSVSLVEKINTCKVYVEKHNYIANIRKESARHSAYKEVINEYIKKDGFLELHIINTNGVEVYTKIDYDDYEKIKQYKWTLSIHNSDIRVIGCSAELGRISLTHFLVPLSDSTNVIDHINRDPLDNRKENLREVSRSINSTNAKPRVGNSSGIRGVYFREARPGIAKASWICEWSDEGKRHSKSFSVEKYGYEEAFRLASSFRNKKLQEKKI